MKKTKTTLIITIILSLMLMSGCVENNIQGIQNSIELEWEHELTVEYLTGEYAEQLLQDGATVMLGSIDIIEHENGTIVVDITEKEYVENIDEEEGFYISDEYSETMYYLSPDVKATFFLREEGIVQAMRHDEFVDMVWRDFFEFGVDILEDREYRLYDIYIVENEVVLLIARY